MLFGCYLCCSVVCVVQLLFVLFYVLFVCKCVLPPGDNPIAVNKYIISYISYVIQVSCLRIPLSGLFLALTVYRIFTVTFLNRNMFIGYKMIQPICSYNNWYM